MNFRCVCLALGVAVYFSFLGCAPAEEGRGATEENEFEHTTVALAAGKKTTKSASAKGKTTKADSSDAKEDPATAGNEKLERATFGGGCFWCLEAVFERLAGVKSVVSGYAGGTVPRPSYEMVCTGLTGHAEVVQITYDPKIIAYEKLLETFWEFHDPTTLNRQGPDEGTQYRSIILYHTEEQKQAARKSYDMLTQAQVFGSPIVTQLVKLDKFYPAEKYHQDYYRRHRYDDYCQMWIVPKLIKLQGKLESAPKSEKGTAAKGASPKAR